jgi:hypothetical protein
MRLMFPVALGLALVLAGCGAGTAGNTPAPTGTTPALTTTTPAATASTSSGPCPTPGAGSVPYVFSVPGGDFPELDETTYWVDPDFDDCTPLRVLFTIPGPGWLQWFGSFKPDAEGGRVAVSIVDVTNLVVDGCTDHALADPPVGRGVDDLATALADLGPFVVTSPPRDVTAYGYRGKYLEWRLPVTTDLSRCVNGEVISWDAKTLSYPFHGYYVGMIEEFWILDVEGSRLVIEANRSPKSSRADKAEMRALLDSITIEP